MSRILPCYVVKSNRPRCRSVERALPADIAVFADAVADWRVERPSDTYQEKKRPQSLGLVENPDILATIAHLGSGRPRLVIGFAAETDDVVANAKAKLARKGCDLDLRQRRFARDRNHGR